MEVVAIDTETFLIAPGQVAPKLVCVSTCDPRGQYLFGNGDWSIEVELLTWFTRDTSVFHNAAFDLAVIARSYPKLIPEIFRALDEGRIHDTLIREKLINLGTHGKIDSGPTGQYLDYSLAGLARKHVGLDLSAGKAGPDIWRLRYAELDGLKAEDYPAEAREYALLDAQATYEVYQSQERHKHLLKPEALHVKASFALQLMSCYGLLVDAEAKEKAQAETLAKLGPEALPLLYEPIEDLGLKPLIRKACPGRPKKTREHVTDCSRKKCDCPFGTTKPKPEGVRKRDVLVPLVEAVAEKAKVDVRFTEKGATATDMEFLAELAPYHPALDQFLVRAKEIKLLTSYFPALEWPFDSGITAPVIHPGYDFLKVTGRISSRGVTKKNAARAAYPSVNIQQADPRVRAVYKPRPGWIYAIADYSALELCCVAQTMLDLYGKSSHADQINAGIDCHAYLGAALAYDGDRAFREEADLKCSSEQEVYDLFLKKKAEDEAWFKHWRTLAKPVGLGFPGGMGINTFRAVAAGYGFKLGRSEAKRLRKLWLQVYPELKHYLSRWVEAQDGTYTSPMGMVRVGCRYTQIANGKALQTPGAEGMKEAAFRVSRACYDPSLRDVLLGCRPVINIHDELVLEVPDDDLAHERALRLSEIMVEGMRTVLPDIRITAEPVLATRWLKRARPVRGADGRLKAWTP